MKTGKNMVKTGKADAFVTIPTPERTIYTILRIDSDQKKPPATDSAKTSRRIATIEKLHIGRLFGKRLAKRNLKDMSV